MFCRLQLPGEIVEDGRESASFDVEKGTCFKVDWYFFYQTILRHTKTTLVIVFNLT